MAVVTGEAPDKLLARIGAPVPDPLLKIFDDTRIRQDEVRGNTKFTSEAKAQLLQEAEHAGRQRFDVLFEQHQAAQQRELDREEGQARAELRNDPPSHDMLASDGQRLDTVARTVHRHAALTAENNALAVVALAPDVQELVRMFDHAEGMGQEPVMAAATFRAEALVRIARRKSSSPLGIDHPETRLANELRARLSAFRDAHPSPVERLKTIAAQRQQRTATLKRAKEHWFRVYGWSDKSAATLRAEALATGRK